MPPPIPSPVDRLYPSVINLSVDTTDVAHRIFRVRETIPLRDTRPPVLLYPEWLPGNHSRQGRVDFLAGLIMRADGKRVDLARDLVDVYAFHVTPPDGGDAEPAVEPACALPRWAFHPSDPSGCGLESANWLASGDGASTSLKRDYLEPYKALIQEASRLLGSHHYDHYDFLFALTSQMGSIGLA